jgi:hypothetical protein
VAFLEEVEVHLGLPAAVLLVGARRRLLHGVGEVQQGRLRPRPADELQPHGEPGPVVTNLKLIKRTPFYFQTT